jgi:hypothetical protein
MCPMAWIAQYDELLERMRLVHAKQFGPPEGSRRRPRKERTDEPKRRVRKASARPGGIKKRKTPKCV